MFVEISVRESTLIARKCCHNNITGPSPGGRLGDRVTQNAYYPEYSGVPEGVDCTYNENSIYYVILIEDIYKSNILSRGMSECREQNVHAFAITLEEEISRVNFSIFTP